jgi:hypothetical protein
LFFFLDGMNTMTAASKRFNSCTVRRIIKETHSTLSLTTGKTTKGYTKVVTKACGTPLFGAPESLTGICLSCARGWEVKDNRFVNEEERKWAANEGKS